MLKLVTFTFCIVNTYKNLPVLAYGNLFNKTIVLYPVIEKTYVLPTNMDASLGQHSVHTG